eukprot:jgi/Undpi1/8638/HiC_scaffold_25.g11103.m1
MDLEIAAGYGECCVCFEPLCAKGASVMTDGSGREGGILRPERLPARVCRHFICQESGTIEKSELVDALKGMFSVEPGALEEVIEMKWNSWDTDHDGKLDATEFSNGLVPFLEESLNNLRERVNTVLPDLHAEPAEWFRFWDEDESGSLERPEIVRALVKSIPELSGRDESWLLGTFASIWGLIDPDGDGKRRGLLSRGGGGADALCRYGFPGGRGGVRESEWGPETRRKGGQRERGGRGGERGGAVGKGLFEEKGGKREEAMGGLGRVVVRGAIVGRQAPLAFALLRDANNG